MRIPPVIHELKLLENLEPQLIAAIRGSQLLIPHIRQLAQSPPGSPRDSISSSRSRVRSFDDPDGGDGQGEIAGLARRILEMVDGDEGMTVQGTGVPGSIPGSAVSGSFRDSSFRRERGAVDEDLRKSLTEAFGAS